MSAVAENKLVALYKENAARLRESFGAVVNDRRGEYVDAFLRSGLPDEKTEGYRHGPLRGLFGREAALAKADDGVSGRFAPVEVYASGSPTARRINRMEMYNGRVGSDALHEGPDGTVWGSLREAAVRYPALVEKYMGAADLSVTAETALNGAFVTDGVFVYVPAGVACDAVFLIDGRYGGEGLCFPRLVVAVDEGASAEAVVISGGADRTSVLTDIVQELYLADNASLEMLSVSCGGDGLNEVNTGFVSQGAGSRYSETYVCLSQGEFTRMARRISLDGQQAQCEIRGLYMAAGSQRRSVEVNVQHRAPHCRSEQLIKGIASDEAVGAFRGLVKVWPHAQKTEAYQQSRNVQMGDTARIFTEPQLEIYADDVKCSHGATVGRLGDDSVFYMRQRGLSTADARRLQLVGFIRDIFARCRYDALCGRLSEAVDERLERIL